MFYFQAEGFTTSSISLKAQIPPGPCIPRIFTLLVLADFCPGIRLVVLTLTRLSLKPSEILYSQSSIANKFIKGGHGLIGEVLDDIMEDRLFDIIALIYNDGIF
jgi:hypothetical protein